MRLFSLALAAAMFAMPTLAVAAERDAASQADLSCMAVFLSTIGIMDSEREDYATTVAGLASGAMYYLGRLEAREPETVWLDELTVFFETLDQTAFKGDFERCGAEMAATGARMTAWGEIMQRKAKATGEKP